jgi:deoxyribodipyrimidine photo-lyase
MTAIVWFRRDLRLHDNPALQAALERHDTVVPLFCLDERLLGGRHASEPRNAFMTQCLVALDEALRARGSRLILRRGRPERTIAELAAECGATEVYAACDVGPFARARDRRVADALSTQWLDLVLTPGAFVVDDLAKIRTDLGHPYSVFTPFHRRWLAQPRRPVTEAPSELPAVPIEIMRDRLRERGELPPSCRWAPGEAAARDALERFLAGPVERYDELHDALGDPGTSELSPYLHFGCLSPRELEHLLPSDDAGDALRRQLCWRDFYAHVLLHNPGNARAEHQERYRRRIKWVDSLEVFTAWRVGMTGYPLVDAGMRELNTTGWMHNRARMVVGSFLVKDLGIDWRWGERWFMRTLIDGDQANNNGNWQWIASVGVDPQPVARRIFNPVRQQQRFDPEGRYVRAYVPELEHVPTAYLAEPWTMPPEFQQVVGCVIGRDYPTPIVDHAVARREALARYAAAADAGA